MNWLVLNEVGNEEKRIERSIVEADSPAEAMLQNFADDMLGFIAEDKTPDEESATIGIYEAELSINGRIIYGKYNHLIAINDHHNQLREMQKLLDAAKEAD